MTQNIYSVFDSKAKAYLTPFYAVNDDVATRSFTVACNQEGHQFNDFAEDYTLFFLGTFDPTNAKFELSSAPRSIINGLSVREERFGHQLSLVGGAE